MQFSLSDPPSTTHLLGGQLRANDTQCARAGCPSLVVVNMKDDFVPFSS